MSVLDASILTEALTANTPLGEAARQRLERDRRWDGPAILTAEVLSAVRGLVLGSRLGDEGAEFARARLRRTRLRLHSFAPFERRVWELRENLTVYDAWYVALAERLETTFVTTDSRVADASGPRCPIEVVVPG